MKLVYIWALTGGAANLVLGTLVNSTTAPLYLDSIFTIFVSVHFGLLPGLLTAVLTNTALALTGQVLFPFVLCSMLTAGISARMKTSGHLEHINGFLRLGIYLAIANGALGSLIAYYAFGGVTEVHGIDNLVMGLVITGRSFISSVFLAGMLTNILDKVFSSLLVHFVSQRLAVRAESNSTHKSPFSRAN